jgi:hypothetical protein
MAIANTKSTHITAADASPPTLTSSYIAAGVLRESVGTVETAAADDAESIYRLVRVPSHARISSILLASDAITSCNSAEVGLYQTAENDGAVVASCESLFASAVDISSATAFTEVLLEATATDISKVEKRLWELAGLTTDPMRDYDIAILANDVTAAGTISMKVKWTT